MSLDQLRAFVAVAELGSVTAAAAALHLTQPPVSRQLASLEDELRCPLFVRASRGMRLTDAGQALLPQVQAILAGVDALRARAERPSPPAAVGGDHETVAPGDLSQ